MKKLQAVIVAIIVGVGVTTIANAARNAYGVYSLPLPDPAPGSFITRSWANTTLHDLGNELTNSLDNRGGTMTGPLKLPNGGAGAPTLTFSQDTTAGLYRPALGGQVAMSIGSVTPQVWSSGGTGVTGNLTVSGTTTSAGNLTTNGALSAGSASIAGGLAAGATSVTTLTSTGTTTLPATTTIGGAAPITASNIASQAVASATSATTAGHVTTIDGASGGTVNGSMSFTGPVTSNGSLTVSSSSSFFVTYAQFNTAISEPTCNASTHGLLIVMRAGGEATKPCLCTLKSDNTTYSWRNIVNGGWGSAVTCPPFN